MDSGITMDRRKQLIADIEEESYLREDQKETLRALVATTEKLSVLATVEDLLTRLYTRRAENYLLIVRKLQQAVRFEQRSMDKEEEALRMQEDARAASALLGDTTLTV